MIDDRWESEQEKLLRYMRISPKTKMEWLRQMNEFFLKASTKKVREMRKKLRERR